MGSGQNDFGQLERNSMKIANELRRTKNRASNVLRPTSYGAVFFLLFSFSSAAFAQEMSMENAESKAQEAHDLAGSDVIYQQADLKALYYQNIQMIELLKEIRDEVKAANLRADKKN